MYRKSRENRLAASADTLGKKHARIYAASDQCAETHVRKTRNMITHTILEDITITFGRRKGKMGICRISVTLVRLNSET